MKLERSKDWYERRIALEGNAEIGAGMPPHCRANAAEAANVKPLETRIAFGTFVELWRRNHGWDAVRLAKEAGLNTEEILEIERNPQSEPEPSAVYNLARLFKLPSQVLLELAGLIEPRTPYLRDAAVRFAARSESMASLNQNEREAFEAFVSAISEIPQRR
ncbi:MAG TPA: XRE family transcriptional regulator [Verrucomicrobiae bacterium]|jgi:transcriptional regulator with XRE-family HTH domain|nr:XRE family transcriptional regulator [Verrucomicrobiae bacterium]